MIRMLIVTFITLNCLIAVPLFYSKVFNKPVYVEPQFTPFLKDFESDAKKHKINVNYYKLVTVFSDKTELGQLGYCMPHLNLVVISKRSWQHMDKTTKRLLLYHEWGHCLLKREHVEQSFDFPTYCPYSIMYPFIEPSQRCYNNHKEFYDYELFNNPYKFKLIPKGI